MTAKCAVCCGFCFYDCTALESFKRKRHECYKRQVFNKVFKEKEYCVGMDYEVLLPLSDWVEAQEREIAAVKAFNTKAEETVHSEIPVETASQELSHI